MSRNSQPLPPDSRTCSWSLVRFSRSVVRGTLPSVSSSRVPEFVKMRTATGADTGGGGCPSGATSAFDSGSGRSVARNRERSRLISRELCSPPLSEASNRATTTSRRISGRTLLKAAH